MPKVKGARRFILFTTPHLADPQWVTPVVEFEDSDDPAKQATPIEYNNMDELERVVKDMGRALARAQGFNSGAQTVLSTFGYTVQDYYNRVKENKERADSAKAGQTERTEDTKEST